MGKIVKKNTKSLSIDTNQEKEIWLFHEHTFGRDPRCSTVLNNSAVSRFHTRISWNGSEWILRDLGSRNGTYINGRLQTNGESHPVKAGDRFLFGDMYEEYLLCEDSEPKSMLITYDSQKIEKQIPLTSFLPIPSAERPLCTVFSGKNNDFTLENETGDIILLEHGTAFTVENVSYHVVLDHQPGESPQTASSDMVTETDNVHLDIAVSPDEESAEITLSKGTEKHVLQPKAHFYLLAYLGRIRNSQTPDSLLTQLNSAENGWVDCDVICKELMINREHLAQQVFRIRQELKAFYLPIAEQIIDRRLRGKMRIGVAAGSYDVRTMV